MRTAKLGGSASRVRAVGARRASASTTHTVPGSPWPAPLASSGHSTQYATVGALATFAAGVASSSPPGLALAARLAALLEALVAAAARLSTCGAGALSTICRTVGAAQRHCEPRASDQPFCLGLPVLGLPTRRCPVSTILLLLLLLLLRDGHVNLGRWRSNRGQRRLPHQPQPPGPTWNTA